MRYLVPLLIAVILAFLMLWVGSWIATTVSPPHRDYNDFTVGRKMDLCGYQVDMRHVGGGYDLERWQGAHCDYLSKLDHCILKCLSVAGTIGIGTACYSDCARE